MTKNKTTTTLKKETLEILLVEFKAPKKLVEAFDKKLKSQFSSRSEAMRSLIRTFLNETSERS